jgi:uncharacterized protein (TIGR03067 family)
VVFLIGACSGGNSQPGVTAGEPGKAASPAKAEDGSAAARAQAEDNLRQIGEAMLNYHQTMQHFPNAAFTNARESPPTLSWRVVLLPYLGEAKLWEQVKQEEPWDSPDNKKLLAQMPKVYASPGDPATAKGETRYRVFTGKTAPFPRVGAETWHGGSKRLEEFTDGAAQTILVAESGESVPWTKPDEMPFGPGSPAPKLGGVFPDGFYALFANGKVRFLPTGLKEKTLWALVTPAGGETIDPEEIKLIVAAQGRGAKKSDDPLTGSWRVESMDPLIQIPPFRQNVPFNCIPIEESFPGSVYTFKGKDQLWVASEGVSRGHQYKLDPAQNPPTIDFVQGFGTTAQEKGIYSVQGDKLILCFPVLADGERPREFKGTPKQVLVTLSRVKEKGDF